MKIAYFINSMEGGGAQSPLPKIVRALEKAGAEVRVFALSRRNGLAIPALHAEGVEPIVRDGGEKDHLSALRWMEQQARDFGADVVWTSLTRATLLGQIAGKKLRLPVVSWQHNAFLKPWNERLLRWRVGASDLWVADSAQVAALTHDRLGVAEEDCVTWPIFAADPSAPQATEWKAGEVLEIGSLGRLHPAKGYDFLIDALALLNERGFCSNTDFRIRIAGLGKGEADLRTQAAHAGVDKVEFVGFAEDPKAFLASLHLYLQPSRREGFCIAAHEAMQAGLPVITSQTGEMPFTVKSQEVGLTFPVGDVPALADALENLLSRPKDLARMGRNARERVLDRFSLEKFDKIGAEIVSRISGLTAN